MHATGRIAVAALAAALVVPWAAPGASNQQAPQRRGGFTGAPADPARHLFHEAWTRAPMAQPMVQENLGNKHLTLHIYGNPGDIRKTFHPDEDYTYTGETTTNWAITVSDKTVYWDVRGDGRIRLKTRNSGYRFLHVVIKTADGRYFVSEEGSGESTAWIETDYIFSDLRWRTLLMTDTPTNASNRRAPDPKRVPIIPTAKATPDLSRVEEVGFSDLMAGGWIPATSRVHSFDLWGKAVPRQPPSSASPPDRDWVSYGKDPGGSKYSTLNQINTTNVGRLERAWTVRTGDTGGFFSSTPIAIDNVLYFASASGVWALEGHTGKQLWKYAARGATRRGVSYWPGEAAHRPTIFLTAGTKLVALDAKTGMRNEVFGTNGEVEMGTSWQSPPALYRHLVLTGGGQPTVRAWDARTGALVWTFNLIAQPGDPGHESWENDAWKNSGGTNVWAFLSVDAANGLVFAPVSQAGFDYAGVERPGNNLYADCVVAIDANTGKLRWYQQTVHHDIWDYDLPAQPALIDITRNGQKIPALVQHTKAGMLFIYNRLTGEPIFPIEERKVPQSTVPGEKTSPTQPFTIKSLQIARMSITKDELYNLTPEHATFCKDLWEKNNAFNDGPYTTWPLKDSGRTAVIFPGAVGGGNWGGVSIDPSTSYIFANVMNTGQWGYLEKAAPGGRGGGGGYTKTTPFGTGNPARFRFWNPETMWPCQNPPWGELFAIDANTGAVAWQVPLGSFPEAEAKGVKNAGTPNMGGAIATAGGLLFIGATLDGKFRAFDSKTGKILWEADVDAPAHSVPATYLGADGRQYVVVPAGGGGFLQGPTGDSIIAFALPGTQTASR